MLPVDSGIVNVRIGVMCLDAHDAQVKDTLRNRN
ncbi:MAG: hypothetical protein GDYSWBUE_001067 [Candidatus Fervidibacterota bacterium]